ncbi:MAG: hypothetical protein ACNA7K_02740, partial [Acholeplasmataceae bacterium]
FRELLLSTPDNQHSNLLFLNIAHNVKQGLGGLGLEAYLTIPDELLSASVEDELWEIEINSFLDTILNLMVSVSDTGDVTLSVRGITEASGNTSGLIDSGLTAFLGLIDNNVDGVTGKDDFDRFLDSKIIYVSIAELLQGDLLTGIASGALSGVLGPDATIDLSAPATVIGVDSVDEDIEVGRITKQEVKKIFSSIKVLGVTNPDDVSALGAQLITNMIDVNDPNDDFSVFLESDYLYVIIARLFSMEALGSFLGETLGSALGGGFDDLDMLPPNDAVGTEGVEEGLLSRVEVRQLFVSFKLLSPEGSLEGIGIETVLGLIDDEALPGETDDFNLFLESKYMWDKISQLLLSDGIVNLIANDRYEASEFVLPVSATVTIDEKERLTQEEIHSLFAGLKQIGIEDFNNIDIDVASIISLTDAELDKLLQSSYLYTVIDLTIKTEETLSLPDGAFEDAGEFLGMIKKTEIKDVFKTLNILEINDFTNVSPETITIAQVNEVLSETDSFVVKYLLSDAIIQALGEDKIPDEAFLDGNREQGVLSDLELESLMAALTILANGDETQAITDIDTENINVGNIEDLKGNESFVIKQLVSDAIVDIIGLDNIPPEAFVLGHTQHNNVLLGNFNLEGGPTNRLTDDELDAMIDAIVILANGDRTLLATEISTDVNVGQTKQLSVLPSVVIKQLVTNSIKDVIGEDKIPADAFIDGDTSGRLTDDEITAMVEALDILANQDDTLLVADVSTDVNVGQVKQLKTNTSLTIKQVLTEAIVDAIDPDGLGKIPMDAYENSDPTGRLTDNEISEMIDAIVILSNDDDDLLVADVSTDVNVGQLKAFKTNNSLIIKQLVSDSIVDTLSVDNTIPNEAHIDNDPANRLTDDEINEMIDAIVILSNDDDSLLVADVSTDVTVGQLKDLKLNGSIIIRQLVSDSIVDTLSVDNTIPNEAHIDNDPANRLTDDEINEMIDAIVILSNDDDTLLVSDVSTDVNVGQLKDLKLNNSIIIRQLVSDSIVDSLSVDNTIPDDAHIDSDPSNRLTDDEINAMIDAIDILANGDDTLLVSDVSTDINIGQLKLLNASPSVIMARLISDSIIDAVGVANVPNEAYIDGDSNNNLTEDEITAMIAVLETLAVPVAPQVTDDVLLSSISTDVTVGQTQDLKTTESLIMKKIISDSIIEMIGVANIPDDAYVDSTPGNRLTDSEIENMIDAISVLGDDEDLVTEVETDINIGQLKELNASPSLIIEKLISDQIITAVGVGSVPDDAYQLDTPGNNLKAAEVTAMIGVLEILAGSETPGDRDHILVSSITPNVTVGQAQQLKTSDSVIIKQIITDSIVTMIGADNIPDDAYIGDDSNNRLTDDEIEDMIDALAILGDEGDLVSEVGTDVTIGQVKQLEASPSLIITQLISDTIIDMLGAERIPDTAHIDDDKNNNLRPSEVSAMIGVLEILADPIPPQVADDVVVSSITIDEASLTVETLKQFPDDSIILNRMISTALIDALDPLDEGKIPDESYTELVFKKDIKRAEIDAVLEALEILGLETNGASNITPAQITFAKIDQVVAIGTTDLVNYPLGFSPLVAHILSTPMVASVTDVRSGHDYGIPTTAYRNTFDLEYDEIVKLISALKTIGDVGENPGQADPETTSLADVSIDPQGFGPSMLQALINEESLIVYRLISIGINDSEIDTIESHVSDTTADNYDPGLPGVPEVFDIKIAEMEGLAESMPLLGVNTINDLTSINITAILDLTDEEVDIILDNENTIIYYIIDDIIQDQPLLMAQLAPSDYEDFAPFRIKRASLISLLKNNNA